jgi:hypothetical protein
MSVGRGWATNAMFMSYITGLPVDLLMAHAGYKTSTGTQPYVLPLESHRAQGAPIMVHALISG